MPAENDPITIIETTEILAYLKKTIQAELPLTPDQIAGIRPDALVADALPLDSLAQTVLVSRIETDFGIMFDPQDWQDVKTVRDFVRLIQQRATKRP